MCVMCDLKNDGYDIEQLSIMASLAEIKHPELFTEHKESVASIKKAVKNNHLFLAGYASLTPLILFVNNMGGGDFLAYFWTFFVIISSSMLLWDSKKKQEVLEEIVFDKGKVSMASAIKDVHNELISKLGR